MFPNFVLFPLKFDIECVLWPTVAVDAGVGENMVAFEPKLFEVITGEETYNNKQKIKQNNYLEITLIEFCKLVPSRTTYDT